MISAEKKDFLVIFIGKILQVFILIFTIKISTSLLSPKEMGNIYIFMTIYSFFVLSLISPLGQYINRHTHAWHEKNKLLDKLGIYFVYLLAISFLSILIGYIIHSFGISNGMGVNDFILLLFCFILFLSLNQTLLPMLNMLHYRLSFTVLTVFTSLGILVLGLVFLSLFEKNAANWLFATSIANLFFLMIGFFVLKNKIKDKFSGFLTNLKNITKSKIYTVLIFAMPLSVATFFMWLQNSGYRIIIEQNISLEFLGFFGVGMAISSQIASIFESILMQYFHPLYYSKISNTTISERRIAINELVNKVLPMYFVLAIFLTLFSKYIVEILVDEKFHNVYIFTSFGIWVEFFRMTANLFGNISQSEMNTKKFMYPYIIGSVITMLLVYLSSSVENYMFYIPLSLVSGGVITMLLMYFFMKKLINFKINYKLLLLCSLISIPFFSVFLLAFKDELFINILILCLYGIYFLGVLFFIYKKGLIYDYS